MRCWLVMLASSEVGEKVEGVSLMQLIAITHPRLLEKETEMFYEVQMEALGGQSFYGYQH